MYSFPEEGKAVKDILEEIYAMKKGDPSTEEGTILGTMITTPHDLAIKVMEVYAASTLSDPYIFENAYKIEREVISMISDLLRGSNIVGSFTSGGSEANILGAYMLRKISGKKYVIAPKTAHFSFIKAENLGIIKLKFAEVDEKLRVVPESVEKLIDDDTAGIIGVAVNTDAGTVDPIEELAEIAHQHDLHIYVDAALGGLLLPFMKVLGRKIPRFDFSLERVVGMGVDPHKFGLVPPPAGMFLFREDLSDKIAFEAPYYIGGKQFTLTSTRPAWPPIAFWAVINALGKRGFVRLTEKCLRVTSYARKRIEEEGLEVPIEPETIIVNIRVKNPRKVAMDLKRKHGISIGFSQRLSSLRLVVMPHVNEEAIERLLTSLKKVLDERE